MKKLKFLLPCKNWSDMMDITVITNYGYNGYKGYNSYKGYNRYNGYNGYKKLCLVREQWKNLHVTQETFFKIVCLSMAFLLTT